jgi:hypothetical protein
MLSRMFAWKPVSGKYHIPIGLNELKLNKVEKRPTKRKGLYMYVVELYKKPLEVKNRQNKLSFKPIRCHHILTSRTDGNFNRSWYRPFTNNLREEDFEWLKGKTGQTFNALVKQREEHVRLQDREREDVTRNVMVVKSEVVGVYPVGTEVEFNYLKLYEKDDQAE